MRYFVEKYISIHLLNIYTFFKIFFMWVQIIIIILKNVDVSRK